MSASTSVSSPQPATKTEVLKPSASERLLSLDVFRGLTIAAMILVNDPGNEHAYWPLEHAKWNGWTPTDLIFPFFMFIVGVSMVLSYASRLKRGASRSDLLWHSLKRAAIIVAIGIALNAFPYYHVWPIRFAGVLQRIGIAYAAASVITLWTERRGRIIATVALVGGYWAIMRLLPVPGFGIPGRDLPLLDPVRNWAALIDRAILPGRLYLGTSDPEGLLSTLPAIGTVLLGVLTGEWLRSKATPSRKAVGMFCWGVAGLLAGKLFDLWMPINKNLWTSSFVIFTAGFALVVLSACYWLIDIRGWRGGWTKPLLVFGTNAIVAYSLASLLAKIIYRTRLGGGTSIQGYIFEHVFAPLGSPSFTSLLFSLSFVAFCSIPVWVLYRKRIFIKI